VVRHAGKLRKLCLGYSQSAPYCGEDLLASSFHELPAEAAHFGQLGEAGGRLLGEREEGLVPHDAEGGAVERFGQPGPPDVKLAENGKGSRAECAGPLYCQRVELGRVRLGPADLGEQFAFFLDPAQAALLEQLLMQEIPQRRKVPRVRRGVGEHGRRERTERPVGALELFVEPDAEVFFEQRRQANAGLVEKLGRDARVEQPRGAKPEFMAEQPKIVIGIMEYELDARISQQLPEARKPSHGQWIDQPGLRSAGELQQIDPIPMAMEAGRFGIDGHQEFAPQVLEQLGEAGGLLDDVRHFVRSRERGEEE
jgi:hypothetical protein